MNQQIVKEGMLPVGARLANGKYVIEGFLSSGGFGNTYVATDVSFDERVAIKELYIKGVCGREEGGCSISVSLTENQRTFSAQQEKFKKEAKRLRKLANAHIIRVHDLFDENGTSYYVMDLVDGESLSQRMKRTQKPLTEQELMLILPQVLDALQTVHAEGIWHLDLKPANIMLDRRGNAVLIDFGASKQLKSKDGLSLSTSSALAYTQGYAPSEQMEQNIDKFGPWTDLYALGATMYNLLTRNQPPSPSDIEEDADEALPMPKSVSKKTRDLILWLMKPNRKMRPQSVADVRQFLLETHEQPQPQHTRLQTHTTKTATDNTLLKSSYTQKTDGSKKDVKTAKPDNPSSTKRILSYAVLAVLAVGLGLGVFTLFNSQNQQEDSQGATDSLTAETPLQQVTSVQVTITKGPDNMRNYTYTGTVDAEGLPQGQGHASFAAYKQIPASVYEGEFANGICEGKGNLTFTSGDEFEGTFAEGFYVDGTYTLADGSYFKGTFQKGSPWNGTWYTKDGKQDGNVRNGQEA